MATHVNLVKDQTGKVIATFENAGADGVSVKPVLETGHTIVAIKAEDNYKENIDAFYAHHSK